MAGYVQPRRGLSSSLTAERTLLADVMHKEYQKAQPPQGFTFRKASPDNTRDMTLVFRKVFATYPSPVYQPVYLVKRMKNGDKFWLALINGQLAATATAEIDYSNSRAEMTDFAIPGAGTSCRASGANGALVPGAGHQLLVQPSPGLFLRHEQCFSPGRVRLWRDIKK